MLLQRRKLVPEIPPTAPTLHIPIRPLARMEPLAPLWQRQLVQAHQKRRVEAEIVLLVLQARRVHIAAENVDVHVVHRRVRVHACHDVGGVVAVWWEERGACGWGRGRGGAHEGFKGGLVGRVAGGEVAVFAAQFVGCECLDASYARADVGEEGGVCGEEVQGVFVVVGWLSRDEEEVYAERDG